jgi:negative regulator of flagellin synthesis FlgM
MEIENNRIASLATYISGQQGAPVDNQPGAGKGPAAPTTGNPGGADQVSLTGQAHHLQALEAQLQDQPVVDSQRVAAVRKAVEHGTFVINPERIADKLISLEQALTDAR